MSNKIEPQPFPVVREYLIGKSWQYLKTSKEIEIWAKSDDYLFFPTDELELPSFEVAKVLRKTNGSQDEFQLYAPVVLKKNKFLQNRKK